MHQHGMSINDRVRHRAKTVLTETYDELGYNYRMTDIQGAIGVEQMKRLKWIQDRKRELADVYNKELAGLSSLKLPVVPDKCRHSYQSYVCLFRPREVGMDNVEEVGDARNQLMQWLANIGVQTRQGTHAVHTLGYYGDKYGLTNKQFPNSFIADRTSIALPLYPQMTDDEQGYVIDAVKEYGRLYCNRGV